MPWTCPNCKTRHPSRNLLRCSNCKRKQPKKRQIKHQAVLKELTFDDFIEINGGEFCWICVFMEREFGTVPVNYTRLYRDHDHQTGEARGLLCFFHNNRLLGNKQIEEVKALLAYLERVPGHRPAPE